MKNKGKFHRKDAKHNEGKQKNPKILIVFAFLGDLGVLAEKSVFGSWLGFFIRTQVVELKIG